ncbi:MAG: (deoxy)nucleoside triphosphate pyrophosphohydrolase [bacterium]
MDSPPRTIVVCGLITDGDRVLISRRLSTSASYPGLWEFPGGKPEDGEGLEDALRRECKEELGIDVSVKRQVARVNHRNNGRSITLEVFLCTVERNQVPQCIEVDDVQWVRPKTLPDYPFPPANDRLVTQLAELDWPEWTDQGSQLWI